MASALFPTLNAPPKNRYLEPLEPGDTQTLRLCGGIGSPYTNKMLAYLRYRRIKFRYIFMNSPEELGTNHPVNLSTGKPVHKAAQRLLPKIVYPDGTASNDSTFLLEDLEKKFRPNVRSCTPSHAGLSFLSALLEDWSDEWLTKSMYHFRWTHDPTYAGKMIALQQAAGPNAAPDVVLKISSFVQKRQVERRGKFFVSTGYHQIFITTRYQILHIDIISFIMDSFFLFFFFFLFSSCCWF